MLRESVGRLRQAFAYRATMPTDSGDRGLTPERYSAIQRVFLAALDYPEDAHAAFLARECGDDDDLRANVESLLDANRAADRVSDVASRAAQEVLGDAVQGRLVGPYELVRELGSGGMGVVYLARRIDEQFDQNVALKLARRGGADPRLVERFLDERQMLAELDHPGIARLLDGGVTDDGRPYFTMEYIDGGAPIDDYCSARDLGVTERVELFRETVVAVAYAQQRLIVHRDLKPGNILVAKTGRVKLLDFGIAKILAPGHGPGATLTGHAPLTPQYASPEQLRGQPVLMTSDTYSLGVVLYELLASTPPYRLSGCSPGEIERRVCEHVPPLASATRAASKSDSSTSASSITGDLDAICAKALHKDPTRRYQNAAEFLDDLDRYLQGRPVTARGDSVGYRATKFVSRNRVAVLAAVAMTVTLVGSAFAYVRDIEQARRAAEREAQRAEHVSSYLLDLFGSAHPDQSLEGELTVREVLDRGAAALETGLRQQPHERVNAAITISELYEHLGVFDKAEALAREAVAVSEAENLGIEPLARSLVVLSRALEHRGQLADARERAVRAHRLVGDTANAPFRLAWRTELTLAYLEATSGDLETAEELYRSAIGRAEEHGEDGTIEFGTTLNDFALLLMRSGDRLDEAQQLLSRAIQLHRQDQPTQRLKISLYNLADLLLIRGRFSEAEPRLLEVQAIDEQLYRSDHPDHAYTLSGLGRLYLSMRQPAKAEPFVLETLRLRESIFGRDHPAVARTLAILARLRYEQGRLDEAEEATESALAILRSAQKAPASREAANLKQLGLIAERRGDYRQAVELYERVAAASEETFGADNWRTVVARLQQARVLARMGKRDQSRLLREGATARVRQAETTFTLRLLRMWLLEADLASLLDPPEAARATHRRLLAQIDRHIPRSHPDRARVALGLARLLPSEQLEQARALVRPSLDSYRDNLGSQHPLVLQAEKDFAHVLTATKPAAGARRPHQSAHASPPATTP